MNIGKPRRVYEVEPAKPQFPENPVKEPAPQKKPEPVPAK